MFNLYTREIAMMLPQLTNIRRYFDLQSAEIFIIICIAVTWILPVGCIQTSLRAT